MRPEHDAVLAGTRRGRVQVRRGQLSVRTRRSGRRTEIQQNRLHRHGLRFVDPHKHTRSTGNIRHGPFVETDIGRLQDQREKNQVNTLDAKLFPGHRQNRPARDLKSSL